MKSRRISICLLALSLTPEAVFAQLPPTIPTTPKTTPSTQSTQSQIRVVDDSSSKAPQNFNFERGVIPTILPLSGTILPTDTLFGQTKPFDLIHAIAAQTGKVRQIEPIRETAEFLAKHDWQGPIADAWLQKISTDNGEMLDYEVDQELLPISLVEEVQSKQLSQTEPFILQVNKSCREMQIFGRPNQAFSDDSALIMGRTGTVTSKHKDFLTLHAGEVFIDTGKASKHVALRDAGIKVEEDASCIINYKPGRQLLLKALYAASGPCLRIKTSSSHGKVIELFPGEELLLNLQDRTITPEKCRLDKDLSQLEYLHKKEFRGTLASLCRRAQSRICNQDRYRSPKTTHLLSPLQALSSEGSIFAVNHDGAVGLLAGRFLFSSDTEQIVQAPRADLYLKAKSALAIEAEQGLLRVQCCTQPNSVLLVSKKAGIPMSWGLETLLLDHDATWTEAMPADGVGRRAFEVHKLNGGNCVFSDFHMGSLLCRAPHLSSLRKSSDPQLTRLRERLLKVAASLQVITSKHGIYQITKAMAGNPNTEKSKS